MLPSFTMNPLSGGRFRDWVAIAALTEERIGLQSLRMRSFRNG